MAEIPLKVDITPDRQLITKMGKASGYFLWQAISELVDNSIDARINEIKDPVEVHIQFENSGGTFEYGTEGEYDIEISDNGTGMTFEDFKTCLKLAYVDKEKEKKKRLGFFGLGLKTSASALGSKFKIISKHYKCNERYSLVFDETKFIKEGDWQNFDITTEKDEGSWHGTIIKIKKRKEIPVYKEKITRLKKNFGLQYSQLIQNNIVKIKVNSEYVKPEPINLEKDEEHSDGKYKLDFQLSTGQKVKGWFGFRPTGERDTGVVSKLAYGFHIFWRNRLIAMFERVGIPTHTEFQKLIGELYLDDFPVTHNKRDILRESPAYDALAGPPKKEDQDIREYSEGELYPYIKNAIDLHKKKTQKRREVIQRVKKAQQEGIISLSTSRNIKKKINKEEIPLERVDSILKEEANRMQAKISSFTGLSSSEKVSWSKLSKVNIGLNFDEKKIYVDNNEYNMVLNEKSDNWIIQIKDSKNKILKISCPEIREDLDKYI